MPAGADIKKAAKGAASKKISTAGLAR